MGSRWKKRLRTAAARLISWGGAALILTAAVPAGVLVLFICTLEELMDSALKRINRR